MAHSLGMATIIEGVERLDQVEIVRSFDADAGQGYFFARPMSADDADAVAGSDPVARFSLAEPGTVVSSSRSRTAPTASTAPARPARRPRARPAPTRPPPRIRRRVTGPVRRPRMVPAPAGPRRPGRRPGRPSPGPVPRAVAVGDVLDEEGIGNPEGRHQAEFGRRGGTTERKPASGSAQRGTDAPEEAPGGVRRDTGKGGTKR